MILIRFFFTGFVNYYYIEMKETVTTLEATTEPPSKRSRTSSTNSASSITSTTSNSSSSSSRALSSPSARNPTQGGGGGRAAVASGGSTRHSSVGLAWRKKSSEPKGRKHVAILGGSFNPVTDSHLKMASEVIHLPFFLLLLFFYFFFGGGSTPPRKRPSHFGFLPMLTPIDPPPSLPPPYTIKRCCGEKQLFSFFLHSCCSCLLRVLPNRRHCLDVGI